MTEEDGIDVDGTGRPLAWTLLIAFAATVLIAVTTIWYTNYSIARSNQKWCDLLVAVDNPIPPDPNNARAVSAAKKLHNLRIDFGC